MGLRHEPEGRFNMSLSEIIDCANGNVDAQRRVMERACGRGGCTLQDIRSEAISLAGFLEMTVTQSVGSLRDLVRAMAASPARKTLVLVSGGLISADQATGRLKLGSDIAQLGREAAAANLDLFALHLDWSFQEALSSRAGIRPSYLRDSTMGATGLELVAGTAGGTVIRVLGTSPDVAFDRVLRETSAHYLLGVAVDEADRDGRPHPIRVTVKRRGAEVRNRSEVIVPAPKPARKPWAN